MTNNSGGIADLSYKGYSGPIDPPQRRWWVIARTMTKAAFKKRAYWVLTLVSSWYYLVLVAILYFMDQLLQTGGAGRGERAGAEQMLQNLVWKDQLLNGFVAGQLMWMSIALMLGAGAIANDRRTNSLLIYLSRPCTKGDYLKGKWMGVFLPLCLAMAIPTVSFMFYAALNVRDLGFFDEGPMFLLQGLLMIPIAAAFHTSLILGVSSLFNNGRIAGGVYAGVYFLTSFFTKLMWMVSQIDDASAALRSFAESATYFAIDGQILGMAKNVMGSNGSMMWGMGGDMNIPERPPWMLVLVVFVAVTWISLQIAWSKIKAVEAVS